MKKCFVAVFAFFVVFAFVCTSFAATIKKIDEPAVKLQPGDASTKPVDVTDKAQKVPPVKEKDIKAQKVPPVKAKPNGATQKAGTPESGR